MKVLKVVHCGHKSHTVTKVMTRGVHFCCINFPKSFALLPTFEKAGKTNKINIV